MSRLLIFFLIFLLISYYLNFLQRCHSTKLEVFNDLIAELDRNKRVPLSKSYQEAESCRSTDKLKQSKLSFTGYQRVVSQEMFDNYIAVSLTFRYLWMLPLKSSIVHELLFYHHYSF